MKKAMALCMAAMLTIGVSATASAAPCSVRTNNCVSKQVYRVCNQDAVRAALMERLESCCPGISKLSPSCGSYSCTKVKRGQTCTKTVTQKPTTQKPETQKPETQKPETQKPETQKPETQKPETQKPSTDTQNMSNYAARVVELVNVERAKAGLAPLKVDAKATQAAMVRAGEIRRSFSHTRPDGRTCFTALAEAGVSYRAAGENIAAGQKTPEQVVAAWMNSEGHRKNILGSQFTAIGVGYLEGNYWTQFFIG